LDDGPISIEESLAMARIAALDGTDAIIATPHYQDMELEHTSPGIVREMADTINAALQIETAQGNKLPVRVFTGAVNRLDTSLPGLIASDNTLTLNRTSFLLVEPPFNRCPPYIEDVLGRLMTQRLVPVIAHPERNVEFQRNPKRLENLVNEGILVQLAAGSLTGLHGSNAQNAAELFLQRGLAHVIASEMHNTVEPRSPTLTEAYDMVANTFDEQEAVNLFETNPNMVLEGRSPQREPVLTPSISRNWMRAPRSKIDNLAPQRILDNWRFRLRAFRQRTDRESTG
jgi:protein-tyrosine phosphatase